MPFSFIYYYIWHFYRLMYLLTTAYHSGDSVVADAAFVVYYDRIFALKSSRSPRPLFYSSVI